MVTAKEISERLALRAEEVARMLVPGGHKKGVEWIASDFDGGTGGSLSIRISGSKAGVWSDFSTASEKGDILDFWAVAKKIGLKEAFHQAKEWLGIRDPKAANPPKDYRRPIPVGIEPVIHNSEHAVTKYLTFDRQISVKTLGSFRIKARTNVPGINGIAVAFPCFDSSGSLLNVKYLGLTRIRDDRGVFHKQIVQEPKAAPALFGWQACDKDSKALLICEGEIDAMSWHVMEVPFAVSVPSGAGNMAWIDFEWDNLEMYDRIYLSFDNDKPGQEAVLKVAQRLGLHRCFIVKLPYKDANECLVKGCHGGDAAIWLREAKTIAPQEIKCARDFRNGVLSLINPDDDAKEKGLITPIFGRRLRFRPGETTLWTGHTSHGKSTLLNQVIIHALLRGDRVALGSFEMQGKHLIHKMTKCIAFTDELDEPIVDQVVDWLGDKLWIYDVMGFMKRTRLFELMTYSVMRHAVGHIVIDSLLKCELSSEDYEEQRKFMNDLCKFGADNGVHIHIVAHPRKDKDDNSPPGIMDVHGGQSVIAQPDNVVCVWRNRAKEKERDDNKIAREGLSPDSKVFVRKQRFTGDEFQTWLWFQRKNNRFTASKDEAGEPEFHDYGIVVKQPPPEQTLPI